MTTDHIVNLQRGHAQYRAAELRAQATADAAREDAERELAALKTAGGKPIDADLPDDPRAAADELDKRAYELTNPPRRPFTA